MLFLNLATCSPLGHRWITQFILTCIGSISSFYNSVAWLQTDVKSHSPLNVCMHKCCFKSSHFSTVFKVHGAGCLQRVCEQLQHCDGSGEKDLCFQTRLPGIPQGLTEFFYPVNASQLFLLLGSLQNFPWGMNKNILIHICIFRVVIKSSLPCLPLLSIVRKQVLTEWLCMVWWWNLSRDFHNSSCFYR